MLFVVDTSRFNTRQEHRTIKRFLRNVVKKMTFSRGKGKGRGEGLRVGVVEYGVSAKVRLPLAKGITKKSVKSAIAKLRCANTQISTYINTKMFVCLFVCSRFSRPFRS